MVRAVIYDLDGTLVYTEELHCNAYKKAFSSYGISINEGDFYRCFTKEGIRVGEFIERFGLPVTEDDIRKIKRPIYEDMIRDNIDNLIAEGAEESLERLYGIFPLGLGTSSSRHNAELLMDLTGFGKYFDAVVTSTESKYVKPDPTCFRMMSEELDIAPEKCVVIEDANKGIIAAHELGMKTIWIPTDITKDEPAFSDVKLDSMKEVSPFLISLL